MRKTVIFGSNIIAEMVLHESQHPDSTLEIVAFTGDDAYVEEGSFCNLPYMGFSKARSLYPPSSFSMLSTVYACTDLPAKMRYFRQIKDAGYFMPNFISPLADCARDVRMGENNIVMALSHVGLHGVMGDCNIIRQRVYLGHDFVLGSGNAFLPGCALGGVCKIGNRCTVGLGSSVRDKTVLADESFVGCGAVLVKNTNPKTKYAGNPARPLEPKPKVGNNG